MWFPLFGLTVAIFLWRAKISYFRTFVPFGDHCVFKTAFFLHVRRAFPEKEAGPCQPAVMVCVDRALGSPRLLIVWPVKVTSVEVPPLFTTVKETVYVPELPYVWHTLEEVVVVTGVPSPKFHRYWVTAPTGDEEPPPSKQTVRLLTEKVKTEVGAWSGVMAMPRAAYKFAISSMCSMGVFLRSKHQWDLPLSPSQLGT